MPETLALPGSSRPLLWKLFCLFLAGLYIASIARDYRASLLATSQNLSDIERAATLNPGNADYRDRAGFYMTFVEHRPDLAISQYRAATNLNPYAADYWLDLANAYGLADDDQQEALALNRALAAEPETPRVASNVAYTLMARGDFEAAFQIFRTVLLDDPSQSSAILETCWRATQNIERMNGVLPPDPRDYLALLNILTGDGDAEASAKLWFRLIALQKSFDPLLVMPYVEYLMAQHQTGQAMEAWNDVGRVAPSFRPYLPGPENLVVNGGFERKILNSGFGWRYESRPGVILAVDGEQFHGGGHSLSIAFDGQVVSDAGLSQTVAVEGNTQYTFAAYLKSEGLLTAHAPQFAIDDDSTQRRLLLTEGLAENSDWKMVNGLFKTGPDTTAVLVKLVSPSGARIAGNLWIDDVSIARE